MYITLVCSSYLSYNKINNKAIYYKNTQLWYKLVRMQLHCFYQNQNDSNKQALIYSNHIILFMFLVEYWDCLHFFYIHARTHVPKLVVAQCTTVQATQRKGGLLLAT